jgi:choline dehydrogenase-like flavoprotein
MGRTLGGSSAINLGMVIFPGKAEFEAWSALGNKGWDHEGILPYLCKFHTYTGPSDKVKEQLHYQGDSELHGTDGPVQLSFGEDYLPFHAAWPLTFEALGYKLTGDPILGIAVGPFSSAGAVDSSTKTRSHAAAAYYSRDVAKRPNLRVLTEAFVEKVVLEENKGSVEATGVQFVGKDGTRRVMFSRREVILAAGAFKTPQILELSGIGSSELLTSHGIPVFIDNADVGENLQDHGLVCGSWEVADGQVSGDSIRDPEVAAAAMQLYQASRSGPLSQVPFVSSFMPLDKVSDTDKRRLLEEHLSTPAATICREKQYAQLAHMLQNTSSATCQYSFAPIQLLPRYGPLPSGIFGMGHDGNFVTVITVLNQPFSRGSTHIKSSNPTDNPSIDSGYLSHPLDLELYARHLLFVEKLMASEPMVSLLKPGGRKIHNYDKAEPIADLETARSVTKETIISNYHNCGSCPMMPEESGGVVNERLLVHGTRNLRIVDASLFPIIPRGNIQATVYAVAEKAADIIRQDVNSLVVK